MTARDGKRWHKRWWVWAIVGVIVIAGIVQQAVGGGGEAEPEASTEPAPSAEARPSDEPAADVEPEATPETEAVEEPAAEPLADRVWANIEENLGGEVTSESPLFAVTEVEDMGAGTIRVYVQQQLDDAGREGIARQVYNLGAWELTELQTVVVRDASSVDSNHWRRDFPGIDQ